MNFTGEYTWEDEIVEGVHRCLKCFPKSTEKESDPMRESGDDRASTSDDEESSTDSSSEQ